MKFFISYCANSGIDAQRAQDLSKKLGEDGIQAILDAYPKKKQLYSSGGESAPEIQEEGFIFLIVSEAFIQFIRQNKGSARSAHTYMGAPLEKLFQSESGRFHMFSVLSGSSIKRHFPDELKQIPSFLLPSQYDPFFLQVQKKLLWLRKGTPNRLTALPPSISEMIGREKEIVEIHRIFSDNHSVIQLHGIPCIGKSMVGRGYFYHFESDYDYVGWINYKGDLKDAIVKQLNSFCRVSGNEEEMYQNIVFKLQNLPGKKLLVIDNLDDLKDSKKVKTLFPGFHLLITSRLKLDFPKVTVGNFEISDLKTLFTRYCFRKTDPAELEELIRYSGEHTLLVEMLAKTYDNSPDLNLSDLIDNLQNRRFDNAELEVEIPIEGVEEEETLFTHLSRLIPVDHLDDVQLRYLKQFSVLPALKIPRTDLISLFQVTSETKGEFNKSINKLEREGWLARSNKGYFCFPVVQMLIHLHHSPDIEECLQTIRFFSDKLTDDYQFESEAANNLYIPGAIGIIRFFDLNHPDLADLCENLCYILKAFGDLPKAIFYAEKCLFMRKKLLKKNEIELGRAYLNLGMILNEYGDVSSIADHIKCAKDIYSKHPDAPETCWIDVFELQSRLYLQSGDYTRAVDYATRASGIKQEWYPKDNLKKADSFLLFSEIGAERGHFDDAMEQVVKAMEIHSELTEDDEEEHPLVADSYDRMIRLLQKMGLYDQALECALKALKMKKYYLQSKHPDCGTGYYNLGKIYLELGYTDEALEHTLKSKHISDISLSPSHPRNIETDIHLTKIYVAGGRYKKALKLASQVVERLSSGTDLQPLQRAEYFSEISDIYLDLGQYKNALEFAYKCIRINRRKCPPFHPGLANGYVSLATACKDYGRPDKGIIYSKKAIEIILELYDDSHPLLSRAYSSQALIYKKMGLYQKALEAINSAVEITESDFNPNHPAVLQSYNNLALVYQDMGRLDDALKFMTKTVKKREEKLNKKHPVLATGYNNLAVLYKDMGALEKSRVHAEKAIMINEKSLGSDHLNLGKSYSNLAMIHQDCGRYEESLDLSLKSLEIHCAHLSDRHPDLATCYNNVSLSYQSLDRLDDALKHAERAKHINEAIWPDDHPNLAICYNNLGLIYYRMDNVKEARKWLKKAVKITGKKLPKGHKNVEKIKKNMGNLGK